MKQATNQQILIRSVLLLAAILVLQVSLSCSYDLADTYHRYVFTPLQFLRSKACAVAEFSLGDLFYVTAACVLLFRVIRSLFRLIRQDKRKQRFLRGLLRGVQALLLLYLVLLLTWGGNYYRKPLPEMLALPGSGTLTVPDLFAFDSLLVERLNVYSAACHYPGKKAVDEHVLKTYPEGCVTPSKASLFGNLLAYTGIEGYFNPFTGEAQINAQMPGFMQPFVIAHELAHQTGIAAEDDANLQAYIQCVQSGDSLLRYSAYLNIWLYTHRRVRMMDSSMAGTYRRRLNPLTLSHLDTLKMLRQKFSSSASDYSGMIYDAYLKMGNQAMGIESYRNVAFTALCWEKKYGDYSRQE